MKPLLLAACLATLTAATASGQTTPAPTANTPTANTPTAHTPTAHTPTAHTPPAATQAAEGEALAFNRSKGNCLACHTMRGSDVPSNVGPELSDIKARFPNRNDLVAILTNEPARNPQTVMPAFGRNQILTKDEINKIIDFLYTL